MAQSRIEITSLAATGVVGGVLLTIGYESPSGQGCRSYMKPSKFRIRESLTNFAAGSNIVETVLPAYQRTGLNDNPIKTRRYWTQAIDPAGNDGPWFPPSNAAGIAGTPSLAGVQPALDAQALVFTAAITDEKTLRETADSALAGRTTTLEARANDATTGFTALQSRIQTEETASVTRDTALATRSTNLEATVNNGTTGLVATRAALVTEQTARATADTALGIRVDGVQATVAGATADARIEFRASAGAGSAASFIDVYTAQLVGGAKSRSGVRFNSTGIIDFTAAQLRILDSGGTVRFAFNANNGRLLAGMLDVDVINAKNLFLNGAEVIATGSVEGNAISGGVESSLSGVRVLTTSAATVAGPVPASNTGGSGSRNLIIAVADYKTSGMGAGFTGTAEVKLFRSGTQLQVKNFFMDDNFSASVAFIYIDSNPPSNSSYEMTARIDTGGGGGCLLDQCKIVVLPLKK